MKLNIKHILAALAALVLTALSAYAQHITDTTSLPSLELSAGVANFRDNSNCADTVMAVVTPQNRTMNNTVVIRDEWFTKDHLGNVRAVVNLSCEADAEPEEYLLEQNDYLPFGTRAVGSNYISSTTNRWRYAGKEEQSIGSFDSGLLDFGARHYDTWACQWTAVDPMAEKYYGLTPWGYCAGSPICIIDLVGNSMDVFDKDGKRISEIGGDILDFYHCEIEGQECLKVVYKQTGAQNVINDIHLFDNAELRNHDVGWWEITKEFLKERGPVHSLFTMFDGEIYGPFNSFTDDKSVFGKLFKYSMASEGANELKMSVDIDYFDINPITAYGGWEQMIGRANLSWYRLGDKTLYLIQDTKSNKSLFLRLPVANKERGQRGFGYGTTKQTYIWLR